VSIVLFTTLSVGRSKAKTRSSTPGAATTVTHPDKDPNCRRLLALLALPPSPSPPPPGDDGDVVAVVDTCTS
jgi:hypothetical protein